MRIAEIVEKKVTNTGRLGELEAALALWGEGSTSQAQAPLVQLEPLARKFRKPQYGLLYRGMLVDPAQVEQQLHIQTNPSAPLASWSTSQRAVQEFMFGWERPWVLIQKPGNELDIFIDLAVFQKQANPFTRMDVQQEVIVKMPPSLIIPRSQFTLSLR